jgi:hypothetical protein
MFYVGFVWPGPCVWSLHQEIHSERIERIQHNFIKFTLQGLGWTTQPLPSYESRRLVSDSRKIAAALFVRVILKPSSAVQEENW